MNIFSNVHTRSEHKKTEANRPEHGRMTMRIAASVIACLITAPAFALPSVPNMPVFRDICGIQVPPARYDRGSNATKLGIDGPHYVKASQVAGQCRKSGTHEAVGCTTSILLGKTIIAYRVLIASEPPAGTDKRCTPSKWRASILRHERAHMAGWPGNHQH